MEIFVLKRNSSKRIIRFNQPWPINFAWKNSRFVEKFAVNLCRTRKRETETLISLLYIEKKQRIRIRLYDKMRNLFQEKHFNVEKQTVPCVQDLLQYRPDRWEEWLMVWTQGNNGTFSFFKNSWFSQKKLIWNMSNDAYTHVGNNSIPFILFLKLICHNGVFVHVYLPPILFSFILY